MLAHGTAKRHRHLASFCHPLGVRKLATVQFLGQMVLTFNCLAQKYDRKFQYDAARCFADQKRGGSENCNMTAVENVT